MIKLLKASILAYLTIGAIAGASLALLEYNKMASQNSDRATAFKDLLSLENQLEASAIEQRKNGYRENMFGGYDREDLTAQVLQRYEELLTRSPGDNDLLYRYAGALSRAKNYGEAERIYTSLLDSSTPSHLMLAMLYLERGDRVSAENRLAIYNERRVKEGMPFLQTNLEKIAFRK